MTKRKISVDTIKAIGVICSLLTREETEKLTIKSRGKDILPVQQFYGRGYKQLPIDTDPLAFEANAARIINANRLLIELVKQADSDTLLQKLLDPENYKRRSLKKTEVKRIDKRDISSDGSNANIVKNLSKQFAANTGLGTAYDYKKEWFEDDKKGLEAAKLKRISTNEILTETGEEDDSLDEQPDDKKEGIEQKESLDKKKVIHRKAEFNQIELKDVKTSSQKEILIHEADMSQGAALTTGETVSASMTFAEGLMRQNYRTSREEYTMKDIIENIQNLDLVDFREKFYKKLDPLFYYGSRCL